MGHVGPTLNKIKKQKKNKKKTKQSKQKKNGVPDREKREREFLFIYFIFSRYSLRYTEIGPSEFVGARSKVLYSMRATRGNQKHRISPSF